MAPHAAGSLCTTCRSVSVLVGGTAPEDCAPAGVTMPANAANAAVTTTTPRLTIVTATSPGSPHRGYPGVATGFACSGYRAGMDSQLPALLISGPPASGKSTLATAVAARLRAALLDQDVLTGALTGVIGDLVGTHDLDDPRLAKLTRDARYEAVLATAEHNLRAGTPVVLVAPFSAERTEAPAWHRVRDRLAAAGGRPVLVWLRLPADELVRLEVVAAVSHETVRRTLKQTN